MLKIIDNVDLKELEKYGFEKREQKRYLYTDENCIDIYEDYDYFRKNIEYKYQNCIVEATIGVTNEKRNIDTFGMVTCKFEFELYKQFVNDTLYDLIKDGLVEKVEE